MKETIVVCCLAIAFLCCAANRKNISKQGRLEIVAVDSTIDFYVFSAKRSSDTGIVVAEKGNISMCKPFKRFIIEDSVHETARLKSGSSYVWIGFNEFTIGNVKVKKRENWQKPWQLVLPSQIDYSRYFRFNLHPSPTSHQSQTDLHFR